MPTTSGRRNPSRRVARRKLCPRCGNHILRVRSSGMMRALRILSFGALSTRRCSDCRWRGPSLG
jgi:predicted RNA-binding Zn-ribbon protein involved in translation (DUF1610 family)